MILQKLASAIRRQDWFQVLIEVMIVIVGIFLGLQVQAWYEASQDREIASNYISRLHLEVSDAIEISEQNVSQREFILSKLEEVVDLISAKNTSVEMTSLHCNAINQSGATFNPVTSLATVTEIINSGRVSVLSNQEIESIISQYLLTIERWVALGGRNRLGDDRIQNYFPDLMRLSNKADIRSANDTGEDFICDFQAMQENNDFGNRLFLNTRRYRAYVGQLQLQLETLIELRAALEKVQS